MEFRDLALGDLDDLAALHADITQLPVGKLFELVDRGDAAEPVAKRHQGTAEEGAAKALVAMVEGKSG